LRPTSLSASHRRAFASSSTERGVFVTDLLSGSGRRMPKISFAWRGAALACAAGIVTAAAQEGGLPGGASSLREDHGDWVVMCTVQAQSGKNVKQCTLSQTQVDNNSRQRVLAIELQPSETGARGTLFLPFGLALENGIAFQIDEGAAGEQQKFRTCLPAGCVVPVDFDGKMLAALRKATTLKVKAVADSGENMLFSISMNGFPGAYDRKVSLE
jgi:invasion protein IalB